MAQTTAAALDRLQALLINPDTGINAQMSAIEARDGVIMQRIPNAQVVTMNLSAEIADDNLDFEYPAIFLWGEEAQNDNREKFAWFSGTIELSLELRLTAELPEALEASVHRYIEAILDVLQNSQGEWTPGLIFSGQYTVRYSPARLGGDNFLQTARLSVNLEQYVSF
jgi:hypothetical protein